MRLQMRRATTVTASTIAVMAVFSGTALAHQCVIASRSEKGDAQAGTKSQAWFAVDVPAFLAEEFPQNPEIVECLVDGLQEVGVPMQFTVKVKGATGSDGVLTANNAKDHLLANGVGVDHLDGAAIEAVFVACLSGPPA